MNITLQFSEKLSKIGVLGHLDSHEDKGSFKKILNEIDLQHHYQIDFYDADTLPPEIIISIGECLDRKAKLKIFTYHSLLTHSLMRLGFNVHQVIATEQKQPSEPVRALVLAGSANSLDKILHIVQALPVNQTSIFIAQHVLENQINLLDQLLRVRTNYRVVMPQNCMPVETETIYVAPPGHHMKVAHGLVYLTRDRMIQFARPSIDVLFESIADEYGNQAMAVLLCGFGRDGVDGCAALKKVNATVIVENPEDCDDACVLPEAAIGTGNLDLILKLPAITSLAAAAISPQKESTSDSHIALFIEAVWSQFGYDFRGYQTESFKRRLINIMSQFGLPQFVDFQQAIFSDISLFNRMIAEISVGVTAFFRHPEQFQLLRDKIFPYLASFPIIKIWSAGCATGEEPYSLAMLLEELSLLKRSRLFATDFNAYLIDIAKSGLFPTKVLAQSQENYLKCGGQHHFDSFNQLENHFFQLNDQIIQSTLFHRHSLVDEGIFNEFQLIVCRNVMIYFKPELQSKILERFARSLHRDGFLVLGPQDGLHHLACTSGFTPYIKGSHIYRLNGETNV